MLRRFSSQISNSFSSEHHVTSIADANRHELGLTTDLVEELGGMPSVKAVSEVRQPQRPWHSLLMLTLLPELCLQHPAVGVNILMTASHQHSCPEALKLQGHLTAGTSYKAE